MGDGAGWRLVAWWAARGAGAGALVGLVVGGIGGRIAMLILRERSPGAVGLISDDGFEIGRVTIDSLNLLLFGAAAGALFGLLYLVARLGTPPPLRLPVATLLAATVGGATFIVPDGVDLQVLEPLWFAVTAFIALPALAGLATAALVERLARRAPRAAARSGRGAALELAGRVAVAAALVAIIVSEAIVLAEDVSRVL